MIYEYIWWFKTKDVEPTLDSNLLPLRVSTLEAVRGTTPGLFTCFEWEFLGWQECKSHHTNGAQSARIGTNAGTVRTISKASKRLELQQGKEQGLAACSYWRSVSIGARNQYGSQCGVWKRFQRRIHVSQLSMAWSKAWQQTTTDIPMVLLYWLDSEYWSDSSRIFGPWGSGFGECFQDCCKFEIQLKRT